MATLKLGVKPHTLLLTLTTGADFIARLRRKDATAWPVDAEARLVFATGQTWDATYATEALIFNIQSEQTDLIPGGTEVTLFYKQGAFDAAWATGKVAR